MIIQIRGTSGSGKSTVMRGVMRRLGGWTPVYVAGRRQPWRYVLDSNPRVTVLGHYESPCGGADNIGAAPAVYEASVRALSEDAGVVLSESILMSLDAKWTIRLREEHGQAVRVLILTTPLEECLGRIAVRRQLSVRPAKELNVGRTTERIPIIERARLRLTAAGVVCRRAHQRQAEGVILSWIGQASSTSTRSGRG